MKVVIMDKNQIDTAIPGERLDIWVATEIMGNKIVEDAVFGLMEMHTTDKGENVYYPLRAYSKNLSLAKRVISKMVQLAYHDEAAYWRTEDRPEVICKAALRAVLERKKNKEALKKRAHLRVIK